MLKALGGIGLRIGRRNIRLMLVLGIIIWVLLFFAPSFYTMSKEYVNNFFARIIKPETQKNGEKNKFRLDDEKKSDKKTEDDSIDSLSERFVKYCFARDEKNIKHMLADNTFYIKSSDGSSFLRCINGEQHVEGYMATDKNLSECRQRWQYVEEDAAMCGVEIILEGHNKPITWYLYFIKQNGVWKLFMLENE